MNLKRAATIVTTGGGLAAWLVGATTTQHVAAPPPTIESSAIERRGAELVTEISRFHDHLPPSAMPHQPGRNLFKFRGAPLPAHAPAAVAAPAPPVPDVPAPPPLPVMRLVGVSEDSGPDGPTRKVFISGDGQLFIATEGDTVMGRYKVTKIAADVVELTDIEDHTVRRLALR
jgi:hypothetical protein